MNAEIGGIPPPKPWRPPAQPGASFRGMNWFEGLSLVLMHLKLARNLEISWWSVMAPALIAWVGEPVLQAIVSEIRGRR